MEKVYVFGHRNPDTDSVTAAITLAYLKKKLGMNAIPVVLSSITRETSYALEYFNVKEPMFLNDIKVKVKDLEYFKNCMVYENASIFEAYSKMEKRGIRKIPIVDKNKYLLGVVSMMDIVREQLNGNYTKINSNYKNILLCLTGEEILKYDNIINGNLIPLDCQFGVYTENIKFKTTDVLIAGRINNALERAIDSKVKLIILTNDIR